MFIIIFSILVIITFVIVKTRYNATRDSIKTEILIGNLLLSAGVILIIMTIFTVNMFESETADFSYKVTSKITHGCSETGTQLNFFSTHDHGSLVSIKKRNLDIRKSHKGYSYIEVTASKNKWRSFLKTENKYFPVEVWTWPFSDPDDSYTWNWDKHRNRTILFIHDLK